MSYFKGKSHFEEDDVQNYLIFQPIIRYFKVNTIVNVTDYVLSWKSKGLSYETIKPPATSDNSLTPTINYYYAAKIKAKFTGSCLKQPKISCTHGKVVNIYIVYEFGASGSNNSDPSLKNGLFGAVTLTKNPYIDKYGCSGYGIGFDRKKIKLFISWRWIWSKCINLWGWHEFSAHVDNKKKDMLVLGKGPTQGLKHTLTAEKMYSISFTVTKNKFCLSLHYNGANSYLFVNGTEIYKFKAKVSEIVATPLCLGKMISR